MYVILKSYMYKKHICKALVRFFVYVFWFCLIVELLAA